MSTPITAGAVALFLESNASLTSDQIKDSIQNTATRDSFTGPSDWGPRLGHGKLNIAAAIQLGGRPVYTISGHVTETLGSVTLSLSGSQSAETSVDSTGNYRFRNLVAGGTYTVTPAVTTGTYQYTFSPPNYTFPNLSANQTANFTAILSTHTISGRITSPNGNGVAGVHVLPNFSSTTSTVSDVNGYYALTNLPAGQSYDVLVADADYYFDPNHLYLGVITKDETANFVARRLYNISGRVTDENNNGLAGVYIQSTGQFSPSTTTDSNGAYRLNQVLEGANYPITIYANGYVFNPSGTVVMNVSANTVVNFTGHIAATQYALYGFIRDSNGLNSRFTTAFSNTLTPAQFVDTLFANAAVIPSASDRTAAINEFGGAASTSDTAARGRALRRVAENSTLKQQEFNRAFVLMQYFGYLRRNPNDAPEPGLNFDGYNFWLNKLNEFNGNFVNADMVKAFIVSSEYRGRFD